MQTVNVHQRGLGALSLLASFVGYGLLARFIDRSESVYLIACYSLLFAAFIGMYYSGFKFRQLVIISVLFRLLFLVSEPALSNDYYRFIWDGRLLEAGVNPYAHSPADYLASEPDKIADGAVLVKGMGALNAAHYSPYPPLNQFFFWLSALLSSSLLGALTWMRVFLIGADLLALYFGKKLLEHLGKSPRDIFLYLLNPLLIVEGVGNVHWEPTMIAFLIMALYFMLRQDWTKTALSWMASAAAKMFSLILLPLLLLQKNWKALLAALVVIVGFTLSFLPLALSDTGANVWDSIRLYFVNFEFNASLYYLARELGFALVDYNAIAIIGPALALCFMGLLGFLLLRFRNREPKSHLYLAFTISVLYLIFSTTVHPWYLLMPLALSVFTHKRFMLVWSLTVILSYTAYASDSFAESKLALMLEYGLLLSALLYEWWSGKSLMPSAGVD